MKLKSIKYNGKEWDDYKDLVSHSNRLKHSYERITPAQFDAKWRKWQISNPDLEPTGELISAWLIPRVAANSIYYKGVRYKGPSALYEANKEIANISFKAFHLNLINKRTNINDDFITACLKGTRVVSSEGTRISKYRKIWEYKEEPKVKWPRVSQQITTHRKVFGCEPTTQDVEDYCIRLDAQWLEKGSSKFGLNKKEFYESIESIQFKCSFKSWKTRIKRQAKLTESIDEVLAIRLTEEDAHIDYVVGILYEVTNIVNGKKYIGITTQTLEERKRGHFRQAVYKNYAPNSFQEAIIQFGKNSFTFKIVNIFNSIDELEIAEIQLISKENTLSPYGYNLDCGGKGVRGSFSQKIYRGEKYKNLASLAKILGLNNSRIASRKREGWTLEEAIEVPLGMHLKSFQNGHKIPLTIQAKDADIPYKKVYERYKSGWSLNEALEKEPRAHKRANAKPIIVNGKHFNSIRQAALCYEISEGTIRKRLKLKWSIDKVFTASK